MRTSIAEAGTRGRCLGNRGPRRAWLRAVLCLGACVWGVCACSSEWRPELLRLRPSRVAVDELPLTAIAEGRHLSAAIELSLDDRRAPAVDTSVRVVLGQQELQTARLLSDTELELRLPVGLAPMDYELSVTIGGRTARLPHALSVVTNAPTQDEPDPEPSELGESGMAGGSGADGASGAQDTPSEDASGAPSASSEPEDAVEVSSGALGDASLAEVGPHRDDAGSALLSDASLAEVGPHGDDSGVALLSDASLRPPNAADASGVRDAGAFPRDASVSVDAGAPSVAVDGGLGGP